MEWVEWVGAVPIWSVHYREEWRYKQGYKCKAYLGRRRAGGRHVGMHVGSHTHAAVGRRAPRRGQRDGYEREAARLAARLCGRGAVRHFRDFRDFRDFFRYEWVSECRPFGELRATVRRRGTRREDGRVRPVVYVCMYVPRVYRICPQSYTCYWSVRLWPFESMYYVVIRANLCMPRT